MCQSLVEQCGALWKWNMDSVLVIFYLFVYDLCVILYHGILFYILSVFLDYFHIYFIVLYYLF